MPAQPVLSFPLLSFPFLSFPFFPPIISSNLLSFPFFSPNFLSFPLISFHFISFPFLFFLLISSPLLSSFPSQRGPSLSLLDQIAVDSDSLARDQFGEDRANLPSKNEAETGTESCCGCKKKKRKKRRSRDFIATSLYFDGLLSSGNFILMGGVIAFS